MKKVILALGILGCLAWKASAAPLVTIAPTRDSGTPVTISISTGTVMTKIPSTQTSGRIGLYVSNPSTRAVAGFFGNCTSTANASTIRPLRVVLDTVDDGKAYYDMREDVCLWLTCIETTPTAASVHYQEVIK